MTERFVYANDIIEKLCKYAKKLMEKESLSKNSSQAMRIFHNAFGQQLIKFDVSNKR
jgi:hypothetical protein